MNKLYAFILAVAIGLTAMIGYLYLNKASTTQSAQKIIVAVDKVKGDYQNALLRHTILRPTFDEKEFTLTKTTTIPADNAVDIASFEIKTQDKIIDVIFDKTKNKIFVKGLYPAEIISLSNNQATYQKDLPVDWSGKTELAMNAAATNNNFCVETTASNLKICHAFNTNLNKGGQNNE